MPASSIDLTRLLPPQYRDKTLDTLVRNLFNRHLSKTDVLPLFGHAGDQLDLQPGDVQIRERDLERQINQLTPVIYAEHGSEKILNSWPDILQKLTLLGVDYKTIGEWFKSKSYNFVPPIDLDKFCNFNQYFWIGGWIQEEPGLPYEELGIPAMVEVLPVFARSNPGFQQQYYVIERGQIDGSYRSVGPQPSMTSWSDWALTNLWVHRSDLIEFLNSHGGLVNFSQLTQAARPIIEYSNKIQLNSYQTVLGVPSDTGVLVPQMKSVIVQLPLFDLYSYNGEHTTQTSAMFYYQEGSQYEYDEWIARRVAIDKNNDFIFETSLVREDKELLFYKFYNESTYELRTIWREGPEVGIKYSKYDTSGTLINQDKFTNFKNYFWIGVDAQSQPLYNQRGLAEYTVVEAGGTTDWSVYNYWVHVSQLKRNELSKYVQAERPIIEFNLGLETQIVGAKTEINQLPVFNLYRFDDVNDIYELIPAVSKINLNDGYVQKHLFARVSELPAAAAIATTPEVLNTCFEFNDEYYIQSLFNGVFLPEKNGTTYGYLARQALYQGVGDGVMTAISTDTNCTPQVLTLTAISATTFDVVGTVSGAFSPLTVGTSYSASGANFTIFEGTEPYAPGDTFVVEVKSYVFTQESLFVSLGGIYRTLSSPSSIITEQQSSVIVDADPELLNGVWEVPPQLEWNVQNETRTLTGQGDLYFHFVSIINAQLGLIGSSTGDNNWRTLSPKDYGLGGRIKQYDGNTALLISMLLQQGVTPLTLVEFARLSYEQLFSAIHSYVVEQIPTMLSNAVFTPPTSGDSIDPVVVESFKEYFANLSPVIASSESEVDDYITTPFYDTTSSIKNLVVTLPYLGLSTLYSPTKILDLELNLPMIVHHDGHQTKAPTVSAETMKSIVTKSFERSPGQQTPGLISGATPPALPYMGQFWFKTSTSELFFYNVISDTGEQPESAVAGNYSYDRSNNLLSQYNGTSWISVVDVTVPWNLVKLDLIEANLILAIEQELFDNCPPVTQRLDTVALQANPNYSVFQQSEFERFGVTYGVTDVYGTTYDPANAFTWNYTSASVPGTTSAHAAWQEIYRDVYGTPRPDLEPWFSCGYATEAEFISEAIIGGYLPPLTVEFDETTMWPSVAPFVVSRLTFLGRPTNLSVEPSTGTLIPPYSTNSESLLATPPISAPSRFAFEDLGPVETYWRKSLNYLYSEQKTFFRLDPLTWVQETWGIKYETINEYTLHSDLKNKESVTDFDLHGDELETVPSLSWFTVVNILPPPSVLTYQITCVSRIDNIFKIVRSDLDVPTFVTATDYADDYITVEFEPTLRGFYWGDGVNLTVDEDGLIEQELVYLSKLRANGFNQLYVQYSRTFGSDLAISINKSLFSSWNVKLGYRFGGFVNTDSLTIESNRIPVVSTAFNVYVKENKFYNSSWLNALRVQLVQRGSTEKKLGYDVPVIGPGGTPGEDWIFRIDNFNPARTNLTWYKYDLNGEYQNFIALDGKRTLFDWKHYKDPIEVLSYDAPFLISGIQNVLNFIFGYSDLREAEGFAFNDQENPVLDSATGRALGYQLLAEQFVAQQFSGVTAGSAFLFNPFGRKVWYKTPRGVVANLFDSIGIEQETVPALLDDRHRHIDRSQVRVFRQDDVTQIVFDEPAYTIHLLTSEYEHVVLFENYSVDTLLYDPFLGQKSGDMFFEGEKQTTFTGRIDFGGHFLLGDQMKRNIESSVQSILGLYDTTSTVSTPDEKERARALLGFQKKQYFTDRGTPDQTEFRFWQGMIANKGTNFSVGAYINSQRFKTAKLDEYWAYKLAEYGDARAVTKSEMRTQPGDCVTELTNYLFLEDDELELIDMYLTDGGYDMTDYSVIPYDSYSLYTDTQAFGMEFFDPRGCLLVTPEDEARWFKYFDLKSLSYFIADVITEQPFTPESFGYGVEGYDMLPYDQGGYDDASVLADCHVVKDSKGKQVRADCFELLDVNYAYGNEGYDMLPYDQNAFDTSVQERYFEMGDYIPGTNPPEYSEPKFKRVNSHTIQILDPSLLDRPFKILAYGPAISKYSPNVLFNFQTNTTVNDDIIWWDPARGSHHPEAYKEVDYEQPNDPARYNIGTLSYKNERLERQKPWGENEVGKVWWDTHHMDWQYYSDSKIYRDYHERLARWGAIADFSLVKINEWVKSSLSPQDYEKQIENDGELAVKYTLNRLRTWYQRPVAWRFSDNPATVSRKFIAYQPSTLVLSLESDGYGKVILSEGDLADSNITSGCKIAAAKYNPGVKSDASLKSIFGLAKVLSEPAVITGSSISYDDGPAFVPSDVATFTLSVNVQTLSFNPEVLGAYKLSNQYDTTTGKRYITLTHVASKKNQKLEAMDIPIEANALTEYKFDQMGITFGYSTPFDRTNPPGTTEASRIEAVATILGDVNHDIVLRSYVDVFSPIPFNDGTTTLTQLESWIAWKDPDVNPGLGQNPPFNKYTPVLGEWTEVDSFLSDVVDDISLRNVDAWTGFEGEDYNPYKSVWGPWKQMLDEVRDQQYCLATMSHEQFFDNFFKFKNSTLTYKEILARTDVYINNVKLRKDRWTLEQTSEGPVINVPETELEVGDQVRAQTRAYLPTSEDLEFDPTIEDDDPLKLSQWMFDYPHVLEEKRNDLGGLTVKNYYFWVKNKVAPAAGNQMGVKQIAALIKNHDDSYAVPQGLKFYNQLDARPNRYALLSLKNLARYVKIEDTYKLRLTRKPTLRDDDMNINLKNTHIEWQLLRQYQPTKLPRVLWDLLTDTLAGETALGEQLPFEPLRNYDERNQTAIRYGFLEKQQILTDAEVAKTTLKYTVLNTRVDKYIDGQYVSDPIAYSGFDINNLDEYLSTPANIRIFMSDLWRYAKPKQLNEIFFAILQDAAAANLELTDFFKTSFISLNEVRTIDTPGD